MLVFVNCLHYPMSVQISFLFFPPSFPFCFTAALIDSVCLIYWKRVSHHCVAILCVSLWMLSKLLTHHVKNFRLLISSLGKPWRLSSLNVVEVSSTNWSRLLDLQKTILGVFHIQHPSPISYTHTHHYAVMLLSSFHQRAFCEGQPSTIISWMQSLGPYPFCK